MAKKPAMPARALKALKASIEKWRKNENGDFQGTGTYSCPLCIMFHSNVNDSVSISACCRGCPVFNKTKEMGCVGTPHENARRAGISYGSNSREFLSAAKAERIFLESLLPKEARK